MGKVKDVQVGNKVIRQLEVKLFVTSMLLQELLDETEGKTRYKNRMRYHINGLQNELDKLLGVQMDDNTLSIFITDAMSALEDSIDSKVCTTVEE